MIISAWKAYLRTVKLCKTPFVFPMDLEYRLISLAELTGKYLYSLSCRGYIQHFFDCSSFAWVWKAVLQKDEVNSSGYVLGFAFWAWLPHCWNVILSKDGDYQVEPQDGRMFTWDKKYWPWIVIL